MVVNALGANFDTTDNVHARRPYKIQTGANKIDCELNAAVHGIEISSRK
jgi:hypothetical protein